MTAKPKAEQHKGQRNKREQRRDLNGQGMIRLDSLPITTSDGLDVKASLQSSGGVMQRIEKSKETS